MFYTYSIFLHFRVIQPVIVTRHPVIKKTLTVTHPQRNGFHQRFETVWQLIEIMYETTLSLKSCMKLPYHWNHVRNYLIKGTVMTLGNSFSWFKLCPYCTHCIIEWHKSIRLSSSITVRVTMCHAQFKTNWFWASIFCWKLVGYFELMVMDL